MKIINRVRRLPGRLLASIRIWAEGFVGSHGSWAPFYYALLSGSFRREQHAAVAGKRAYARDVESGDGGEALLRRNIHRLEKGLLMRPRRELFGLDYLDETVDGYAKRVTACGGVADAEVSWAHGVLDSYFRVVARDRVVDAARQRFLALPTPAPLGGGPLVPYRRDLTPALSVSYAGMLELAQRRRSVRWFLPTPVPRELVNQAMVVALQSPSACNRQPFTFRVFDQPDLVRRVAAVPMGTAGYDHNIPVIAVVVGQLDNFFDERDRHLIYIDGSLAAMSFVLALETLGVASCVINWPDIEEQAMVDLLGLDQDERPVLLIAIGYPDPDGLVAASVKKPVEQVLRFNFE